MNEIWKAIEGFEGYYEISDLGRVRSLTRKEVYFRKDCDSPCTRNRKGRIMKCKINNYGYVVVHLRKDNLDFHTSVHRLVAQHFIENTENKPTVNHKDCNKLNNNADNLEWSTHKEQADHAVENELFERRGSPKFSPEFKKKVLQYFQNTGCSIAKLAVEFGISQRTAGRIAKGSVGQHQEMLEDKRKEANEIFQLRLSGMTYEKIGEIYGIGISQTKRICDKQSRLKKEIK